MCIRDRYIPRAGEITIFISAFVGSLIGFLWYNTYPAQVFMGDTGSLTIGGIIAVISIAVRKEWLLPLICGIFLIENLSVLFRFSISNILSGNLELVKEFF